MSICQSRSRPALKPCAKKASAVEPAKMWGMPHRSTTISALPRRPSTTISSSLAKTLLPATCNPIRKCRRPSCRATRGKEPEPDPNRTVDRRKSSGYVLVEDGGSGGSEMPLDETRKYQTIEVAPVTPVIGAEVSGIDLGAPLSDLARDEIEAALNEHLVLFFRDQDITAQQHVAFGKRFGEVPLAPGASFGIHPDAPEVSVLEYDEARPPNVNHYHSDGIFRAVPEFASVLRAIVAPASGGDTIFVNCIAAYE